MADNSHFGKSFIAAVAGNNVHQNRYEFGSAPHLKQIEHIIDDGSKVHAIKKY